VRWVSYGLILAIVAVVGWWGYEQLRLENGSGLAPVAQAPESESEPPVGEATETTVPVPPDPVQPAPVPGAPEPAAAPVPPTAVPATPAPSAAEPDAEARLAAALSAPEPSPDATTSAALEPQPPPGEPVAQEIPQVVSEVAVVEPVVTEQSGAMDQAVIASTDTVTDTAVSGDRLELIFERDCWIEIRDSEGTKLAFGLAKSGSFQEVVGTSPFRVLLGDSGAVTLVLNGVVVDPAEFGSADGRPARFSLGGS
jgi:cytoskeletal protein RodZ